MNNYSRTIEKLVEFLDKAPVVGIGEANQLLACVNFLGKLQNGELLISEGTPVQPPGLAGLAGNGKDIEKTDSQ